MSGAKSMRKWIILGGIALTVLILAGVFEWKIQSAPPLLQDTSPQAVQGERAVSQDDSNKTISPNVQGEGSAGGSQLHNSRMVETHSATVYVSSARPDEDKLWGKQELISLELIGKGETAQPLSRVLQFYLEGPSGRWTPVSSREFRWQENILLPGQPLLIRLSFRGLEETKQRTLAVETQDGKTLISLTGEDLAPPPPLFRCEKSVRETLPLQVRVLRTWRVNASPMAQPLPGQEFLALDMELHPIEGSAPQLQMWNVFLVDQEGRQYPATPYALPVSEQLAFSGVLATEKRALVGFEVPIEANPNCLVIVTQSKPIYVPLSGA